MLEMWFPSKNMITHRQITLTTTSFSIQSSRVLRRIPLPIVEELGELLRSQASPTELVPAATTTSASTWGRQWNKLSGNLHRQPPLWTCTHKDIQSSEVTIVEGQRNMVIDESQAQAVDRKPQNIGSPRKKDFSGIQAIIVEFINDEGYTK